MVQIAVQRVQVGNRIGHVEGHACLGFVELVVLLVPHPQYGSVQNDCGMFGCISGNFGNIKVRWYKSVWQGQFQVLVEVALFPNLKRFKKLNLVQGFSNIYLLPSQYLLERALIRISFCSRVPLGRNPARNSG